MPTTQSRQVAIHGLRFNYQYNPDTRRITARGIAPFIASSYTAAKHEVAVAVRRHDVLTAFLRGIPGELTFPIMSEPDGTALLFLEKPSDIGLLQDKFDLVADVQLFWKYSVNGLEVTFTPLSMS